MKIGIRLHDMRNLPFVDKLDEVNRQGFTCVHLALSKVLMRRRLPPAMPCI